MFLVWAYESQGDLVAGPPYDFKMHGKRGSSMEAVEIIEQDTPGRTSDSTHAYLQWNTSPCEN